MTMKIIDRHNFLSVVCVSFTLIVCGKLLFEKMIGFTDEKDFPNKLESWSDRLHPDDKEAVLKEFNDTIADYSGAKNYDVEYRFKVKSGEWRWFHAIGRLLRRDNGVPLSYVGMFVDITDRKKKEKQ